MITEITQISPVHNSNMAVYLHLARASCAHNVKDESDVHCFHAILICAVVCLVLDLFYLIRALGV